MNKGLLAEQVHQLIEDRVGDQSIEVSVTLTGPRGTCLAIDERRPHYAASTMKLPVLLAAYRERDAGRLGLDALVPVHEDFLSRRGSSFTVDQEEDSDEQPWARLGEEVALTWLCRRMIVRSSNLATDLVCEQVGFPAVAEAIEACGISSDVTAGGLQVQRMIGDFEALSGGWSNLITTAGLAAMMVSLSAGVGAATSTTAEVLDILAANEMDRDVRAGLPEGTWVAHKNGWVSDAVHDVALVRPADAPEFALAVGTSGVWAEEEDGHGLIRSIAAEVWAHRHEL